MTRPLEGRCALITGANQGLGLAIARAYVEAGASVLMCARNAAALEQARAEVATLASPAQQVLAQPADVSRSEDVARLARSAQDAFPQVHILVKGGRVHISPAMSVYAAIWLAVLMGLSLAVVLRGDSLDGARVAIAASTLAAIANVGLFAVLHRIRKPLWDVLMRTHVAILVLPLMLAFTPRLGALQTVILFVVYFAPTLLTARYWLNRVRDGREAPGGGGDELITQTAPPARTFPSGL